MDNGKNYKSNFDRETQKLGEDFAGDLAPGDIVLLYGDLGFGKTTFVKGIAKRLGIKTRIISPTFVIVRSHEIKNQKSKVKSANQNSRVLHHIDLYRIENKKQLDEIGIEEILQDKLSVKLIEWPEKMGELPTEYWRIEFKMDKNNTRTININKHGQ